MITQVKKVIAEAILLENNNLTINIWGGDWIPKWKGLHHGQKGPVGESWEFSGHRIHPNHIRISKRKMVTLPWLIQQFPHEILGPRIVKNFGKRAPFLVKIIDAKETLSLQVHPDDNYARRHERDLGKYESWVILDVERKGDGGTIYLGFNKQMAGKFKNPDQFRKAFLETMEKTNHLGPSMDLNIRRRAAEFVLPFVNPIKVKKNDVFELPPGTIHAIGKGVRIFEIQKPSHITYRIWDWNRPDTSVKKGPLRFRPLHLNEASQVLDFSRRDPHELHHGKFWVHKSKDGRYKEENLVHNTKAHYAVNKIVLKGPGAGRMLETKNEFMVFSLLKGRVRIDSDLIITAGQSVLIPAQLPQVSLTNMAAESILFKSYCP